MSKEVSVARPSIPQPVDYVRSEHVVQFFDSPDSLGEAVALFLSSGYQAGDHLLVVAKPRHFQAIAEPLRRFGHPVEKLVREERLTVLDAATSLRKFMRGGSPDPALFDQAIGSVVRGLARGRGLRIYGEMVEILAEETNYRGADQLEALWNGLAERVPINLFCGYSSAHFAAPNVGDALRAICDRHHEVHQSQTDLLGNWLLANRRSVVTAGIG
jgi:hypothetical protein